MSFFSQPFLVRKQCLNTKGDFPPVTTFNHCVISSVKHLSNTNCLHGGYRDPRTTSSTTEKHFFNAVFFLFGPDEPITLLLQAEGQSDSVHSTDQLLVLTGSEGDDCRQANTDVKSHISDFYSFKICAPDTFGIKSGSSSSHPCN